MPKFTKVLSTSIEKLRLISKVLGLGSNDSKTPYNAMPFGIDARPIKGMKAVYMETGNDSEPVIVGYINENSKAGEGETRFYSVDSDGAEQNYIWVKNDGNIEIGGDADNMVRYSTLKSEYDKTKDVLDAILLTLATPINEPGNGAPSAFQAAMIAAVGIKQTGDISGSKIDEVKTS